MSSPDKSNSAASDALSPPAALIGQVIWQAAALALGFAFVLICLNAMRVGLLTRDRHQRSVPDRDQALKLRDPILEPTNFDPVADRARDVVCGEERCIVLA